MKKCSGVVWLSGSVPGLALDEKLVFLAAATGLPIVLQGTVRMRIEGRMAARLSAALWSHALSLPMSFFRGFSAGDLSIRIMCFQELRDRIAGVVSASLLTVLFLLPAFALLFFYTPLLGWLGLVLRLLSLPLSLAMGAAQIPLQRQCHAAGCRGNGDWRDHLERQRLRDGKFSRSQRDFSGFLRRLGQAQRIMLAAALARQPPL